MVSRTASSRLFSLIGRLRLAEISHEAHHCSNSHRIAQAWSQRSHSCELPRIQAGGVLLGVSSGDVSQGLSPRRSPSSRLKLTYFPHLGTMLDFRRRTASNAAITAPIYALQFEGSLEGTELRRHRARADAAITGQAGAEMR